MLGHQREEAAALLAGTAGLYEERPELVDLLVAHVVEAAHWAEANPAEARMLPDLAADKITALERQIDFLSRQGVLEGKLSLDDLIAPAPVQRPRACAGIWSACKRWIVALMGHGP